MSALCDGAEFVEGEEVLNVLDVVPEHLQYMPITRQELIAKRYVEQASMFLCHSVEDVHLLRIASLSRIAKFKKI